VQLQHTDRHFRIEKKWTAERDIGVSFFLSLMSHFKKNSPYRIDYLTLVSHIVGGDYTTRRCCCCSWCCTLPVPISLSLSLSLPLSFFDTHVPLLLLLAIVSYRIVSYRASFCFHSSSFSRTIFFSTFPFPYTLLTHTMFTQPLFLEKKNRNTKNI